METEPKYCIIPNIEDKKVRVRIEILSSELGKPRYARTELDLKEAKDFRKWLDKAIEEIENHQGTF